MSKREEAIKATLDIFRAYGHCVEPKSMQRKRAVELVDRLMEAFQEEYNQTFPGYKAEPEENK